MKMKKMLGMLAACLVAGIMLTGCGNTDDKKPAQEQAGKVGVLMHLNASEEQYNEFAKQMAKKYPGQLGKTLHDFVYYDDLKSMQMALSANKIAEMSTYKSVANYLVQRNGDFAVKEYPRKMNDSFCFALRKGQGDLAEAFNGAIDGMKQDGTLDKLVKEYITDLKADSEPPAVELPQMAGAEKLKIGVTGDLPPLDLTLADGKPAGFSTAVLAEISKRLGKNIELVPIDSAARASALSSNRVDVVFWVAVPKDSEIIPADVDTPKDVELTKPYYEDLIVHVVQKK